MCCCVWVGGWEDGRVFCGPQAGYDAVTKQNNLHVRNGASIGKQLLLYWGDLQVTEEWLIDRLWTMGWTTLYTIFPLAAPIQLSPCITTTMHYPPYP